MGVFRGWPGAAEAQAACIPQAVNHSRSCTLHLCRCAVCGPSHSTPLPSLCEIPTMVSMLPWAEGLRGRGGLIPLDQRVLSATTPCRPARSHAVARAGAANSPSGKGVDAHVRCAAARLRAQAMEVSAQRSVGIWRIALGFEIGPAPTRVLLQADVISNEQERPLKEVARQDDRPKEGLNYETVPEM